MKLWTTAAFTLLVTAGLSIGQTTPAKDPVPAGQGAPTPSPQPPAPDLTFKPSQTEAPLVPGTAATVPPVSQGSQAAKPAAPAVGAKGNAGKPAPAKGVKPVAGAADTSKEDKRYILGPNDVVGISVFDEGHVPGTYAIGPDGRLSVPLIVDFKAVGLTLPEVQAVITQKLSAFIIDPVVNVQLLRNNSKKYTLVGGLNRTGPVPLLQETTIFEAIAAAGGFKEFANSKDVILRRGSKDFHFNYKEVLAGKNMKQNITIEDGDIIIVKE